METTEEPVETTDNTVFLGDDGEEFTSTEVQRVIGEDGDDTIIGALNATEPGSTLFGNGGDDYIRSRGIGDRVFGGKGNDTIVNDNGQAIIYGDLGNDFIIAKDSNTTIFGGRSFGEATAEEGKNILLSLGGKNILKGGGGNDSLVGEAGGDTMAGNDGDDTIQSGPGGRSYLFGNKGADRLISRANDNPDTLFGGQGDDTLLVEGEADAPLLFGGVGNDTLKVTNASVDNAILVADVNPDGSFGGSDGDEGDNYLFVEGGKGHQLFGNAGNDTLALGVNVTASVSMFGGRGNDYLVGGSGASYSELAIFGGRGDDTILFNQEGGSGVSNSVFWGDNDFVTKGFGNNIIKVRGSGNTLRGGNDNATGTNSGNNFIQAIAVDLENLGSTNNMLMGGAGNDTIDAGSSGAGDTLNGGPAGDNTYIFSKGQTIVQDTVGINTYFGIEADKDPAVTVTGNDFIGGAANFFVTGDQTNNLSLGTGGIITTESDKTQLLKVDNASGVTKTGGGDDQLKFGNVSGLVDAGAGDDVINISGSVSGSVSGGAGNDVISVNGSDGVTEGGAILGGEGDDSLYAQVVQAGGLMDGGEGADTLVVDSLFGVAKGGGLGKNVFNIDTAFGGAQIFTGAGDEEVILKAVGSAPDGAPNEGVIIITGGKGNNRLGVSYIDEPGKPKTVFAAGTDTAELVLEGVGGDRNILQGSPFGKDVLKAGPGKDVLYGGSSGLGIGAKTGLTGDVLAVNGLNLGDGDLLQGNGGNNSFIFMSNQETGSIQDSFTNATVGSGVTVADGMTDYVISVGTDNKAVFGGNVSSGTSFVSSAFNVDTLTGFRIQPGKDGDRIFLNKPGFVAFENDFNLGLGTATPVRTFASNPGLGNGEPFLFGRIQAGGGTTFSANPDGNVYNDGAFFASFVVGTNGGDDFGVLGSIAGAGTNDNLVLFDTTTRGLYLTREDYDFADLIAVLGENSDVPTNANVFNDIFQIADVNLQAGADIALF
nr:calcium-binding protein [Geitlerinema sp. P-1104]